jgi:hypothetical protein
MKKIIILLAGVSLMFAARANIITNPDFDLDAAGNVNLTERAITNVLAWQGTGNSNAVVPTALGAPLPPTGKDISGRVSYNHWEHQLWQSTGHITQANTIYVLRFHSYPLSYVWALYVEIRAVDGSGAVTTFQTLNNAAGRPWKYHEILFDSAGKPEMVGKELQIRLRNSQEGGGGNVLVTGFRLGFQTEANTPAPANNAANVGTLVNEKASVLLQWKPGVNPQNPAEPYPPIRKYYLYLSQDQNQAADPNLYYKAAIDAGNPINLSPQYGPELLNLDGRYRWRVDTGVDVNGTVTGPDDPNTIAGTVWSFSTLQSLPIIQQQPAHVLTAPQQDVTFSVTAAGAWPLSYQWYKSTDLSNATGDDDTALVNAPSLLLPSVSLLDEGYYYCKIWNTGDETSVVFSNPARLGISRLVAHWTLDQDKYNGLYMDESGNYPAEPNGVGAPVAGLIGQAAEFPGTGYLSAGDKPEFGFGTSNACTVSAWVKTPQLTHDWASIVGKGPTSWRLARNAATGSVVFHVNTAAAQLQANGTVPIVDNAWHFVVGTFDGKTARLYIDGVQAGSQAIAGESPINQVAAPLWIGGRSDNHPGRAWTGLIDDVQVYSYALDFETIAAMYFNASGLKPCIYTNDTAIYNSRMDFNKDCAVNVLDMVELAAEWLKCGLYPACN